MIVTLKRNLEFNLQIILFVSYAYNYLAYVVLPNFGILYGYPSETSLLTVNEEPRSDQKTHKRHQ